MRTALAGLASVAALAAGCSNPGIEVRLRVPGGDHPLAGADAVAVTLRDASGQTLAFSRGAPTAEAIELPHVAAGTGWSIEVVATLGTDVLARGRSCSFDVGAGTPPIVPVWFSRVGRFAATSGPDVARQGAAVFAWGAGALVAGGSTGGMAGDPAGGTALATTEAYDASAAKFAPGPALATPRSGARAVAIAPGVVLLVAGAAKGAPAVEALTASHSTAEPAGLAPDLVEHAVAATGDGSVVIAGGRVAGSPPVAAAWIVTQGGASVEPLPPMAHPRARLTLTSAGDGVAAPLFVIGGVDAARPVADIELFDRATQTFSPSGLALVTPRSGHTVTRLPSGLLLVVGGTDAAGAPIAEAEIVDPIAHATRPVARLHTARSEHTATLLASGRVLITGGVDAAANPLAAAEIFDPALGAEGDFVPTSPLDSPRAAHAVVPLCDGTYLVVGGAAGAEIYNPL